MKKNIAIILMGLFFTVNSFGGPFGVEMGMKIEEIDKNAKKISENGYEVSVPKPHPAFEKYIVQTCSSGLYSIRGVSKIIATNGYGSDLKSSFESMEKKLKNIYGKNKKYDLLMSGSLWTEQQYWMMGLSKKDRSLVSFWAKKYKSKMKDNLNYIILEAHALNQEKGLIILDYQFLNFGACVDKIESKEDNAL